jgi:peroxisomal membrane protein 4
LFRLLFPFVLAATHANTMPITPSTIQHHLTEELAAIVGALVGGAKYGIKIRLPHALVMTLLFRRDLSAKQKIHSISRLVLEHASNLAAFATIYKSILAAFKWTSRYLRHHPPAASSSHKRLGRLFLQLLVDGPFGIHNNNNKDLPASMAGYPECPYHALVAGACGGYWVWGRYTKVNQQVVLYLTSRVLVGVVKRAWEHVHHGNSKQQQPHPQNSILYHPQTYPMLAALVWGLVMVLFEESPHVLHRSLKGSMDEIYRYQLSR